MKPGKPTLKETAGEVAQIAAAAAMFLALGVFGNKVLCDWLAANVSDVAALVTFFAIILGLPGILFGAVLQGWLPYHRGSRHH